MSESWTLWVPEQRDAGALVGVVPAAPAEAATSTTVSAQAPTASVALTPAKRKAPKFMDKWLTKRVQRGLIKKGYRISGGATGVYGPQTKRAVKRFERANGVRGTAFQRRNGWRGSDGYAGSGTVKRLVKGMRVIRIQCGEATMPRFKIRKRTYDYATSMNWPGYFYWSRGGGC